VVTGTYTSGSTTYDADGNSSYLTAIGITAPSDNSKTVQEVFNEQLNRDFIEMAKSVAKNGGFYIGRYEAGTNGASKKNQLVLTAASSNSGNYVGATRWYGLYKTLRENIEKTNSVKSHMIWGCQYDQVIKFIGKEAEIGHSYQTTTQQKTGYANDPDILKNIYDLEGNNSEWTAQASASYIRAFRGSDYNLAAGSSFNPASYRNNSYPSSTRISYTSRRALYM